MEIQDSAGLMQPWGKVVVASSKFCWKILSPGKPTADYVRHTSENPLMVPETLKSQTMSAQWVMYSSTASSSCQTHSSDSGIPTSCTEGWKLTVVMEFSGNHYTGRSRILRAPMSQAVHMGFTNGGERQSTVGVRGC